MANRFQRTIRDAAGNVAAAVAVTVTDPVSGSPVSIFADEALTSAKANPGVTDANGRFDFWAAETVKLVDVTAGEGVSAYTLENVLIASPGDGLFPDGSDGDPSISFENDDASGFYSKGGGVIGVSNFGEIGPTGPIGSLLDSSGKNEAQASIGVNPRRIFYNAAGTYAVNAVDHFPALHLIILPAGNDINIDCSGLFYNVPYTFCNAAASTTATLDFGDDIYLRAPEISPGLATVKTVDLPPNQKVTITRLGGNQVFFEYAAPPYSYGSWTPTIYGSSVGGTQAYALRQARWHRIGNLVTFNGEIRLSSTSGATGNVRIGGLPFVANGSSNDVYPVVVPYWLNWTSAISGGSIEGSTDYISIWAGNTGDIAALNASEMENASRIRFGGSYRV